MEEVGRGRWKKFTAVTGRSSPRWVEEVARGTQSLGYFITLLAIPNFTLNILSSRISHAIGAFIPIVYLHFVWEILSEKKNKPLFVIGYLVSAVMFFACLTPLVVKTLLPKMGIQYYPEWGYLYPVYASLYLIFPGYAQYKIAKRIKIEHGTEKIRLSLFFYALGFAFGGGASLFLLICNIPFPPFFSVLIILYPPMMAYAILAYRFLDIEVIIKKTLTFSGIFVMFMAVVSSVTAISQSFVGQYLKLGIMANGLICSLLVALLYNPTHKLLINITDKYLFQKSGNFKIILNRLAKNIIDILDLHEVGETVLNTLQESLRLETGTLILRDEKNKHYGLLTAFNLNQVGRKFPSDGEFIRYFSGPDKSINLEEPDTAHILPNEVVKNLETLKAVICVPLFAHGELIGLLTMGKKRSDQEFTQEEIDYLPVVASQTAIALKKAQLVEDVIQEREGRVKAENEAKMVAYAKSIAHEIKNALAGVYEPVQFLTTYGPEDLKKILRWMKENKPLAMIEKKLLEIIEYMKKKGEKLQTKADEITIVAKTAESTLSSDETVFSEVNIRVLWDATLASVKKSITTKTFHEIEAQLFPYGNVVLLRRVLINLTNNAIEALGKRDDGEIFFQAYSGMVEGKDVAFFEITDNGPGIQQDVLEKIFEQGFSTKPKPKSTDIEASGHGQGLWVCKHVIEEIHHGNIRVVSELGKGTTFKMWIPIKGSKNADGKKETPSS